MVVDFDNLENHSDAFKHDAIYCCLGTTRGKSGVVNIFKFFYLNFLIKILNECLIKEGFKKVDYDYIVNSARLAKENVCKHFHLVSSSGAGLIIKFLFKYALRENFI